MIKVRLNHKLAIPPKRSDEHAAGYDLYSLHEVKIWPGETVKIDTGISMQHSSDGYYFDIKPRSGLAANHSLDTLAGVIDNNYDGSISVLLVNHGKSPVTLPASSRVAQIVPTPYDHLSELHVVDDLPRTRGGKGFGSSGID